MACTPSKLVETVWVQFQLLHSTCWSHACEYMATMQSSCHSRWMQWWTRTNSKKLLLLLLWQALISFSRYILKMFAVGAYKPHLYSTTFLLLFILSPFLIWLADAKFGRYRLVLFGSLMVFGSSVVFYLALLVTKDLLSLVFYSLAYVVSIIGKTCFSWLQLMSNQCCIKSLISFM